MIDLWFLDEAAAPVIDNNLWMGIGFMAIAILLEAFIMLWMRYNLHFGKTFIDSLLVNFASLAVGFVLVKIGNVFNSLEIINLLLYYGITVIIESAILYLLNRSKLFSRTFITTVVMNLVTYLILAVLIKFAL